MLTVLEYLLYLKQYLQYKKSTYNTKNIYSKLTDRRSCKIEENIVILIRTRGEQFSSVVLVIYAEHNPSTQNDLTRILFCWECTRSKQKYKRMGMLGDTLHRNITDSNPVSK